MEQVPVVARSAKLGRCPAPANIPRLLGPDEIRKLSKIDSWKVMPGPSVARILLDGPQRSPISEDLVQTRRLYLLAIVVIGTRINGIGGPDA